MFEALSLFNYDADVFDSKYTKLLVKYNNICSENRKNQNKVRALKKKNDTIQEENERHLDTIDEMAERQKQSYTESNQEDFTLI